MSATSLAGHLHVASSSLVGSLGHIKEFQEEEVRMAMDMDTPTSLE